MTSSTLLKLYVDDLIGGLSNMRVIGEVSINNISHSNDMVLLGPSVRPVSELPRKYQAYAVGLVYNIKN